MKTFTTSLFTAAILFATSGCGFGIAAGADFRPGTTFAPYATFAWDVGAIRRAGDVRLEESPFFEESLFAAVSEALAERGIQEAESGADLLVHYHLAVEDHIEVYEADPNSGYPAPPPRGSPGTQVVQFEEGTFIVHFVDARTRETLWIGWARGDIGPALESAGVMQDWVNEAVDEMFGLFPM